MKRIHLLLAVAVTAPLLLTACGSTGGSTTTARSSGNSSTPAVTSPTQSALAIGQPAEAHGTTISIHDRKSVGIKGSFNYQGVKAKLCNNTSQAIQVTSERWTAFDAEGGRSRSENSGQTELKPAYPQGFSDEPAVDPGTCVTGWLAFDASAPLQQLRYSNSDGDVLIWNLPN